MTTFRLFLHILSSSVWVGGQIVLAGLVPTLREIGDDAPKRVARAYNRIAWPAFAVLCATGIWNLFEVLQFESSPPNFHPWFEIKFLLVLISGGGAALHIRGGSKAALAIGGALASLGAVGAMFLGLVIQT